MFMIRFNPTLSLFCWPEHKMNVSDLKSDERSGLKLTEFVNSRELFIIRYSLFAKDRNCSLKNLNVWINIIAL